MYAYELLENGCYYLVKEKEDSPIILIKVAVETDHCLFIQRFDDLMATEWKLRKDPLFDIIECLSDEKVKEWEEHYRSNEDAYYEDDEEE
ncbi:MAG: hypothetical protein KAX45_06000 [Chitinophagaceae bacterium]|nr:hypothetical protein [Chitinophagaceae bacterium]MBP6590936.1 hypothetical protein [Chitinophagaceae bacterium]MBP8244069.1 hypothetical protein [Chitinophagaceae bacterium]